MKPPIKILTIWQSLVVDSYRSFFYELGQLASKDTSHDISLGIVAPEQFIELGSQVKKCDPFQDPFSQHNKKRQVFTLPTIVFHLQIVVYRHLVAVLKNFFQNKQKLVSRNIIYCMSEPYSITSLLVWITARIVLGKNFEFYCFALQNIHKKFPFPLKFVQKFIFAKVDAILVLGKEHEEVLRKHGYKGACIDFPLWFDSKLFCTAQNHEKKSPFTDRIPEKSLEGKIVIGFSGSLRVEKGIKDLFKCLENFQQNNLVLLIAGDGALKAWVQNACHELKNCDAIFLGPLDSQEMPVFLRTIDLLIVPSQTASNWKEQFGRIIVEALACGCLVIGSNSGEIPTVVNNDRYIFKEGDTTSMGQVLKRALADIPTNLQNKNLFMTEISKAVFQRYSDVKLAETFYSNVLLREFKGDIPYI